MTAGGLIAAADAGALAAAGVVAAVGLISALWFARRRQAADAALVLLAATSLAALLANPAVLRAPSGTLAVVDGTHPAAVRAAAVLTVQGDGLTEAAWQDLPARALQWTAPTAPVITLDFARQLPLGRPFELTLRRSVPLAGWRLQLLDENGKLLAQATAAAPGNQATLRWLPPVAERVVLRARALGADGRVLEQGPVPLRVQAAAPLQVQGRFGAASFDVLALNQLLVGSDALVDWQVTLGKTLTRNETARDAMAEPDLLVIDAAYFERASDPVRAALLAQVARGLPLLMLAANASEPALWLRELQLPLVATVGEPVRAVGATAGAGAGMGTGPGPAKDTGAGAAPGTSADAGLVLPVTAWTPALGASVARGPWTANDAAAPWLWRRAWQAGRISWLGVSDWHRVAISAPQALGAWWQVVVDQAGVQRARKQVWVFPDAMPLAGQRSRVCARGDGAEMAVQAPGLTQAVQLQRRDDNADAACGALWPQQAGWQRVQNVQNVQNVQDASAELSADFYVYGTADWPQWQRALRRDATARYALRAAPALESVVTPMPAWPWALLAGSAMLVLWWRERRGTGGAR